MKRGFLFGLAVLLTFFCLSCCTIKPAPVESYGFANVALHKRIVKLAGLTIGGDELVGASGFALDSERIMTAGHFCLLVYQMQIRGELKSEIRLSYVNNNDEVATMDGAVLDAIDEQRDICVVRRPLHGIQPLYLVPDYSVTIYDEIMIGGAPFGFFPYTAEGRVIAPKSSEFSVVDLNDRLVLNVAGHRGVSGGPVIDVRGRVVGIVMAKTLFDHLLFAVHADMIREFLNEEYGE